jgi:uncharacterized protein (DUF983 family)
MSNIKHDCPHCGSTFLQVAESWEALEQVEDCLECGKLYRYVDSEGGPNALTLIKAGAA